MATFSQTNRTKGQDLEKQVLPILGSKLVQLWEQSLFNQIGGASPNRGPLTQVCLLSTSAASVFVLVMYFNTSPLTQGFEIQISKWLV